MTEEYKNGILNYITGSLEIENQKENSFRDNEILNNELTIKLNNLGIRPVSYVAQSLTSESTSNYIFYGDYTVPGTADLKSWIAILNENGNVLDIITTYESGVLIEPIKILIYDENGFIYGIDKPNNSQYYRIILLNNIAIPTREQYICNLRASYYIRYNNFQIPLDARGRGSSFIKKVPEQATYYIFGYYENNINCKPALIKFSNVVGVPIEWEYYEGTTSFTHGITFEDFTINIESSAITLDMYYRTEDNNSVVEHEYFDGSTITNQGEYNFGAAITDIKAISENEVYVSIVARDSSQPPTIKTTLEVYKIDQSQQIQLYSYTTENFRAAIPTHYINIVNGIVFSCATSTLGIVPIEAICCVYYNNNFIVSPLYTYNEIFFRTGCVIQKIYGLYRFILQTANYVSTPTIVVYDNQYSGESYVNYNSLVPLHSELYSNGYIKFARTLYNRQFYDNQSISTINVPNNYLNDISVYPSNLISATMTGLDTYEVSIVKNRYENLYINFINTLNVMDEDENVMYPSLARRFTTSINTGTQQDYEEEKICKLKITMDEEERIIPIEWESIENNIKQMRITIYSDTHTNVNVDFTNNDGSVVFLSKYFNIEPNKYYAISQKLRIE